MTLLDALFALGLIALALLIAIAVGTWIDERARKRRREILDRRSEVERDARRRL